MAGGRMGRPNYDEDRALETSRSYVGLSAREIFANKLDARLNPKNRFMFDGGEDFDDGNDDDWTQIQGVWSVKNGEYVQEDTDWLLLDIAGTDWVAGDMVYFRTYANTVVAQFEVVNGPKITSVSYPSYVTTSDTVTITAYGDYNAVNIEQGAGVGGSTNTITVGTALSAGNNNVVNITQDNTEANTVTLTVDGSSNVVNILQD